MLMFVMLFMTGCSSSYESKLFTGDNVDNKLTVFQEFEKHLNEKGLSYEKVTIIAELVGAKQGIRYKLTDMSVEIYRFDETSAEYIEANNTQSLQLDGFGAIEAVVKNGYAINSDNSDFVAIFEKIVQNR